MAKQGMHKNDHNDPNVSKGHNNPDKSVEITTGSPKKKETYAKQAREHEDTGKVAQVDKNEWHADTHHEPSKKDREGDD